MTAEQEGLILAWVTEALELRHGTAGDPQGRLTAELAMDDPALLRQELIRVRARSDRVEYLLASATQAKARAKRAEDGAKFEAQRAYDEAARMNSARRVEFSSAAERNAEASLDSFDQRRQAHLAARLVSVATEAYDVINQCARQLSDMRSDLRAAINAQRFESSLER